MLSHLNKAEENYLEFRERWELLSIKLSETEARLASTMQANSQLTQSLQVAQSQVQVEQARAERQRNRANQLATGLKDIHRALFSGNI